MSFHKILWVDDDPAILDSAERLFRSTDWSLVRAESAARAKELMAQENFAAIIADQRLESSSGVEILEFARGKAPAASRILLTGAIDSRIIEDAVNRGHIFRFVAKPWDNAALLADIAQATEYHRLKVAQATLLKEVSTQNRQLERLTSGLEQLVTERTLGVESSKIQAEKQLSHVRELVRFVQDLANLNSVDELIGLVRKELKGFHELRPPMLGYVINDRRPMILFSQGKQVVEREARQTWSARSRIRINEYEDRVYLANEFGRPFVKVLAVPLKRRAVAIDSLEESPATLFFEHSLPDDKIEAFLSFVSERLQPLSIALDRILLEYHLKYTSLQWESTFDGIRDPIAIVDIDFNVVRANRHFSLSQGGARAYETSCHKVFAGEAEMCHGCPVSTALKTGEPQKGLVRRGEKVFEVYSYAIRLPDDTASTNVINHYVDVTSARELGGRMMQNEKMAAIGLLAGNIAHELNNPLTGIRSLAQVLIKEVPSSGTLREDLMEVEKAAERSQKIIENLLDFSKGDTEEKRVRISINEIVRRTLPMIKTAMREHRSEIELSEDESEVWVEPHLVQQVVFNLVNNACQAMKDPGEISVETGVMADTKGRWCVLRVRDTGVGIPKEIIGHIFEAFFTTKEKGKGTGLGLSMSQQIIEKFGGDISVASEVGRGTTFTVRLPLIT